MSAGDGDTIVLGTIRKNNRGDVVRVSLSQYEGKHRIDVRECFQGTDGKAIGTKKGVNLSVEAIGELIDGLLAARREAIRKGWLRDDGAKKAA